jgi:molecular chaperone HscA
MINMLRASVENASSDASARMLAEARVDARRLIDALEAALNEDASLLRSEEADALRQAVEALAMVERADDVQAIKRQTKMLSEASDEFAARRMNREIRKALQGQSVDALSSES